MPSNFSSNFLLSQAGGQQYEILRKAHFHIDIEGIDSVLAVQSANLPKYSFDVVDVFYYNDRVKLASKPNPSELRIELLDFVSPDIVGQLWTWFKQIYDPATGKMGLVSSYKRQGRAYLYGPDDTLIRTWTCQGLFPTSSPTPDDQYAYSDGQDVQKIALSLSVDRCSIDDTSSANLLA